MPSTKFSYFVQTADNSTNLYDIGLYNTAGTLVCHEGATAGTTFAAATGVKIGTWTASCNVPAGEYYLALTGDHAVAIIGGQGNNASVACFATPATNNTTSGGVLNSTVTFNADALVGTGGCVMPYFVISQL